MSKQNNNTNKKSKASSDVRQATKEQIEQIEKFVEHIDENYMSFSRSLTKDLAQVELLRTISANQASYQPNLAETMTNALNFDPRGASSEDVERWLTSPYQNEKKIRALSQYLEYNVGQYHRVMWYYNTIKAFNYELTPISVIDDVKFSQADFKNSYHASLKTLAKINIKNNYPQIDLATLQEGATFWWIDDLNDQYNFIQLPTDACKITGKWQYGWTACIDLTYFDKMMGIEKAIPELSNAYEVFLRQRKAGLSGSKLAPFQYYPLPYKNSWVFTCDPNRAVKVNNLANAMGSSLDVLSYRQLLKDQSLLELWKVLAFEIPKDKNGKMQMTYEVASDIIASISSVLPENIAGVATPFKVTPVSTSQTSNLDKILEIGSDQLASDTGVQPTLFGKETKSAKAYTIGMEIDFAYASTHMYIQFNNLTNWLLYQSSKTYRWQVKFEGNVLNKELEVKDALSLVTSANFPVSYLVSKSGYEPHEFYNQLQLEDMLGIKDMMKPLVSQFQKSGSDGDNNGRPSKGDHVEDDGEKSREYVYQKDEEEGGG